MKALDGRHCWEVTDRSNATVTHTCRACGKKVTFELIIPDATIETLVGSLLATNIYRTMWTLVR
jgi:hypothetical protein